MIFKFLVCSIKTNRFFHVTIDGFDDVYAAVNELRKTLNCGDFTCSISNGSLGGMLKRGGKNIFSVFHQVESN